jgi:hypothetical protein
MRSTITSRGQTVVPAAIRERFRRGPVDVDPIAAFRGSGPGGSTARLLAERQAEREREG